MFVADVAAGNAYRTHAKDLPEGFCPPQGYNSVVAEVRSFRPLETFHAYAIHLRHMDIVGRIITLGL